MTIVVTEFRQESNSLSPFLSDLEYWKSGWILNPHQAEARLRTEECAVRGMVEVIEESGRKVAWGPAYYSQSGGTADNGVLERYLVELKEALGHVDGLEAVFFSFHGALQTTHFDDAEAEIVRRIRNYCREATGREIVVAASTDSHGYISRRSVEQMDVITGYHTYPHTDFVETGRRAARLGLELLDDRESFTLAWVPIPMMVSASGYDTLQGPYRNLIENGQELVNRGEIMDFSVYQMQPWLDIPEPLSSIIVCARSERQATHSAERLAAQLYAARHAFEPDLYTVADAVGDVAASNVRTPAVLVDSADSPNAGAAGDSMYVVREVLETAFEGSLLAVVRDPAVVTHAMHNGVGAELDCEVGGSVTSGVEPLRLRARVKSLHDGVFRNFSPGSAGLYSDLGSTAVLVTGNLTLLVCERLVSPGDPNLYRGFGVDPRDFDLVVVKANTSFKKAYQGIAETILPVDSPGPASPNIRDIPFQRVPRNIFPWTDDDFQPRAEILRMG